MLVDEEHGDVAEVVQEDVVRGEEVVQGEVVEMARCARQRTARIWSGS